MSNSSLATYTLISPNKNSPRNHKIDTISIHCFVSQVTAKRGCEVFQPSSEQASCNYVVGYDGSIGLCVEEKDRSWCTSSSSNDHRAITIETASENKAPYKVTAAAYAALLDLVTDICRRNGAKKLLWFGDKAKTLAYAPKSGEMVMTVHRWFANKSCPGDYLYNLHGEIAAEVTKRLGGSSSTTSPSTGTGASGSAQTAVNYTVKVTATDLNIRSGPGTNYGSKGAINPGVYTIVAEAGGTGASKWGKLKSGAGWISLDYATKNGTGASGSAQTAVNYTVKVTATDLNIRSGPGTNYGSKGAINPGVYTIVAEAGGTGASKWGKLKSGAGWISLDYATKNGTSSSTASKAVTVGSTVTIQAGAVYGGLATSRGAKVPDYVSGKNRRYTVKQIATHKGVQEALLKEITSWVALSYLTVV